MTADTETPSRLPLAGLRVIEMQAIGPVPFAGRVLATLGATVTVVKPPVDAGLGVPLPAEFDLLAHGKSIVVIDLKSAAGHERLMAELARSDVLIEGFRIGVLERLGLAPASLLAHAPRLVIGRLSGWGAAGPYAARAGHDINYLALAGVLHAVGTREAPAVPLNLIGDFGGGAMHLLVGVLALLVRRGIDQQGGVVESSILAGTLGLTPMFYGLLAAGQWIDTRAANLLDGGAPFYRCYATACGGQVAVGALEPKFYRELLGLLALDSVLQASQQYERASWPETAQRFAAAFAGRSRDDWAAAAEHLDACLAPVLSWAEAAAHPHNRANHWFADGEIGPQRALDFPL